MEARIRREMPKQLEEKLRKEGIAKGLKGDRLDAYVYGGMQNMGWKPEREKHKGKTMLTGRH